MMHCLSSDHKKRKYDRSDFECTSEKSLSLINGDEINLPWKLIKSTSGNPVTLAGLAEAACNDIASENIRNAKDSQIIGQPLCDPVVDKDEKEALLELYNALIPLLPRSNSSTINSLCSLVRTASSNSCSFNFNPSLCLESSTSQLTINSYQNPLFVAAATCNIEYVSKYCKQGLSVNFIDESSQLTPLEVATLLQHHTIMAKLIAYGAEIGKTTNNYGHYCLPFAAATDNVVSMRLLLDAGADASSEKCEKRGKHKIYITQFTTIPIVTGPYAALLNACLQQSHVAIKLLLTTKTLKIKCFLKWAHEEWKSLRNNSNNSEISEEASDCYLKVLYSSVNFLLPMTRKSKQQL